MRSQINTHFPDHLIEDRNSDIYIADYSNIKQKGVPSRGTEIALTKPDDIESFLVKNNEQVPFS